MINLFRRSSGFNLAPRATFDTMYRRDNVREEFNEPQTYAELMVQYRQIGQRCNFSLPWNTEEMLYRSQQLQILQRSAMALYTAGHIAPPVQRHIEINIKKWTKALKPKRENVMNRVIQLVLSFA